jgi:hypothetical protein
VRTRLVRSRLGLWLLLLGAGTVALGTMAERDVVALALRLGMLAAVLGAAFGAGSDADRAALALTLTHPTTPLAVAMGRWLGAFAPAGAVVLIALAFVAGLEHGLHIDLVRAGVVGVTGAAATAAAALSGVWMGGNTVAGVLFLYIATASAISPDAMAGFLPRGPAHDVAVAIAQVVPGVWRYRALAGGSGVAWCHGVAWIVGGVALSAAILGRRRS